MASPCRAMPAQSKDWNLFLNFHLLQILKRTMHALPSNPTSSNKLPSPLQLFAIKPLRSIYFSEYIIRFRNYSVQKMFSKSSLLLLALSACSVRAATDCFTQVGDDYLNPASGTHRVSVGVDCRRNSSTDPSCNPQSSGYVTEPATLNITTDSSTKIYDAIREKTHKPFNETLTGLTNGSIYHIHAGSSGYIGFTAALRCFKGTVGDCIGGDVEADTAIEACTPVVIDSTTDKDGFAQLKGQYSFVSSTPEEVANMTTNPADNNPKGPKDNDNGAGQLSLGGGAMSIIVAGVLFGLF